MVVDSGALSGGPSKHLALGARKLGPESILKLLMLRIALAVLAAIQTVTSVGALQEHDMLSHAAKGCLQCTELNEAVALKAYLIPFGKLMLCGFFISQGCRVIAGQLKTRPE